MIDSLTEDNVGDFNQRYSDTYGWLLQEDGSKTFVYINEVSAEEVRFSTGGKMKYTARCNSGVQFEFIPIDRGWFKDADGNGYYLQRRVARQFRRGISEHNTNIWGLDNFEPQGISYKLLHSIFATPQVFTFQNKATPQVLSKFFALDRTILYFYNMKIGTIIDGVAKLDDDLVKQEFMDMIKRSNYQIKV